MSIPLTGTGGLFERLGKLIGGLNEVTTFQGSTLTARAAALQAQYAASDEDLIDSLYSQLASAQNSASVWPNNLRSLAQATVTQMVADYISLPSTNYQAALNYLVNVYLPSVSATVQRNTVSASVTPAGGNTGNGVVLASMLSALGLPLEYAFAENITATVTRDAQSGGAVAGQEQVSFAGEAAVTNQLSWLFPTGSGASSTLTAVNASANGGRGTSNQLNNGSFETWVTTPNVPDSWHIGAAGVAGTSIFKSTAQHYDGLASLNLLGDGSELTAVESRWGVDFGSGPSPLAQYAVNLWIKVDVVPSAGVLSVELVDGTGTQLVDAQGNASAFTIALTGATTSWVAHGGFLRTPRILPAQTWLQLRLSTALDSGKNVYMDRVSLAQPNSFYVGGPAIVPVSGSINFISGDSFGIAVSNNYGGDPEWMQPHPGDCGRAA